MKISLKKNKFLSISHLFISETIAFDAENPIEALVITYRKNILKKLT